MMKAIALCLSAHMRTLTNELATGKTQVVEQYVHPRWAWVIFPLVLLAATLSFLIATIVTHAIKHVPT